MAGGKIDRNQWESDFPTLAEYREQMELHKSDPNEYKPWNFFLTYKGENKNGKK